MKFPESWVSWMTKKWEEEGTKTPALDSALRRRPLKIRMLRSVKSKNDLQLTGIHHRTPVTNEKLTERHHKGTSMTVRIIIRDRSRLVGKVILVGGRNISFIGHEKLYCWRRENSICVNITTPFHFFNLVLENQIWKRSICTLNTVA